MWDLLRLGRRGFVSFSFFFEGWGVWGLGFGVLGFVCVKYVGCVLCFS